MHRSPGNLPTVFLLGVLVLVVGACATSPERPREASTTRVAPDADALAEWLDADAASGNRSENFFIHMADTQLGMSEYPFLFLVLGATWNDDQFETDARLFEAAIRHANALAPDFVIICGDLINRPGHPGQIAEFQRIAGTLDASIPLFLVAGNHDVESEPTAESLRTYRRAFGPDRYSFREGGIYGIVLNSQLIDSPDRVPEEAARQLEWVRHELRRAKKAGAEHIIVFQHHPYFLNDREEDDEYFNVEKTARLVYLDLFQSAGVEAVLSGHLHRTAASRDGEIQMLTAGPVGRTLGDDPSGFRIIGVGDGPIRSEYFATEVD